MLSAQKLKTIGCAISKGTAGSADDCPAITKNCVSGALRPCSSANQSNSNSGKKAFHDLSSKWGIVKIVCGQTLEAGFLFTGLSGKSLHVTVPFFGDRYAINLDSD